MVADRIKLERTRAPARLSYVNRDFPDNSPNRLDTPDFPGCLQVVVLPRSPTPRRCKRVSALRHAAERREQSSKVRAHIRPAPGLESILGRFPIALGSRTELLSATLPARSSEPRRGRAVTAMSNPHSVLIVDDEPNILLSLQFLMRKSGYDVPV